MANTLTDLIQTTLLPQALPILRGASRMAALVNPDYSEEAKKRNDTIRVPLPQDLGPARDMNTATGSTSTDLDDGKVDIKLDKWKYQQFEMDDGEIRKTLENGIVPDAMRSAIVSLADAVNNDLLGLYKDIPYYYGTAGTTPYQDSDLTGVRKILNINKAEIDMRRLMLDPNAEAKFLSTFKDADKTGSTEALRNASLGRLFGFETFMDQSVLTHTKGTMAGTPLVNGAVAKGAVTVSIDGSTGTNTLLKGDIIVIGGNPYVVTADATAAAGAFTGVGIYPPAIAAITDNAPVTIIGSHVANLAFHRNAFALVVRRLDDEQSKSSDIGVMVDEVSGIPLRVETWRDSDRAVRKWRFDLLYGVKTLSPQRAARLLG